MRILFVSNQIFTDGRVTNPVLQRMKDSMLRDSRVEEVSMMPVMYSFLGLKAIRCAAKKTDIIHVHFGGLYAFAIWFLLLGINSPKIITFHGTDIHAKAIKTEKRGLTKIKIKLNQYASFLSIIAFDRIGFVAKEMKQYVPRCLSRKMKRKAFLQSLGVDYQGFQLMEQKDARARLHLDTCYYYALFSTISNTNIKRQDIAEAIVKELGDNYKLLVMCGVKPNEVPLYINASDFLLLTSDEEGSPNIIRESLSLNKPVFSVNVGDSFAQLKGLNNSRIIDRDPSIASKQIVETMCKPYSDDTRETMRDRLDFDDLNKRIIDIYEELLQME